MKKLILSIFAASCAAGPLLAPVIAEAQPRDRGYNSRDDRQDNRRANRNDNRRADRHDDRRGDRRDNRNDRRNWDQRHDNGYWLGDRWYYGPPAAAYRNRNDFRPGYRAWSRGSYLPQSYRSYVIYDYGRYRLRPPPRGYHWVRVNDDYVLAAIATGLILDAIINSR